ncbi:MAG TPA: hypothetical protein VK745_12405 [Polyangiaceae bacterium]|nr:hypothetical protein [Polyangiaceae bacterium]
MTTIMVCRSARFKGAFFPLKIMVEHRRLVTLLTRFVNPVLVNAPVVGCLLLVPSVALAGPKDSTATKLANQAMQTDYVGTQFKKAEQKLKKAIQQCGASACSYDVVGRLHRDLATVYIGGMNQVPKGKAELKLALAANPDLQLDNDLATPELRKAFKAAGGHTPKVVDDDKDDKDDQDDKDDRDEKKAKPCTPGSDGCDAEAKPAEESAPASSDDSSGRRKNWVSIHFEQDFLVYSAQNKVCASNVDMTLEAPEYACYQGGSQYGFSSGQDIYQGVGNHVAGGVGVATSRILIGFDRLLSANLSAGVRLGFAFGGGPTPYTGDKFLPLHAELRGNYWFGNDPFASDGVRPYVGLSVGLAEIDGHVPVEYYQDQNGFNTNNKGTLDAWRKTGKAFAGLGLGMMIPFAGSSGIVPEVRAMEMLGATALAFDVSLGYAYGF